MPRRTSARALPREESPLIQPVSESNRSNDQLARLRSDWKWAAFSQFFFTFNHLFAMNDVSLNSIEEDLVYGSHIVLPRIMQRLLYTVSYDRKISLNNWQTALRKQYRKRDPAANPIGPEPRVEEVEHPSNPPAEGPSESLQGPTAIQALDEGEERKLGPNMELDEDPDSKFLDSTRASTIERGFSLGTSAKGASVQPSETDSNMDKHLRDDGESAEREESKNWLHLPMLAKLDSLYLLMEWQFQSPMRLRTLMRSDDENASWRIEPIGYDSKKNAYWLIGADRIWLQRSIPKPSRPKAASGAKNALKRKRGGTAATKYANKGHINAAPMGPAMKRPRLQEQEATSSGTGRSRAAKAQAKMRLDAQAKELAELNRQAGVLERSTSGLRTSLRSSVASSPKKGQPLKTTGIRVSARLRGREDAGEWQAVPDEWLNSEDTPVQMNGKEGKIKVSQIVKTGLESDGSEISDLTELTEGSSSKDGDRGKGIEDLEENRLLEAEKSPPTTGEIELEVAALSLPNKGLEESPALPEGFVEWETICVTLEEWEHIADRFAKATHYAEKALHKVLLNDIVPFIVEELREIERKQKLSMAITQRKRSSRLLIRQSEKEEAEAVERKRREEDERNGRARRQEARAKKEEAERERRELAREVRRREREEKELKDKTSNDGNDGVDDKDQSYAQADMIPNDVVSGTTKKPTSKQSRKDNKAANKVGKGRSGINTPAGEDWELDCEVCLRHGINLDDGMPMMSCGNCSRWQHIACHDLADQQAGRKRRNWDQVEFICTQCKRGASRPPTAKMPSMGLDTRIKSPYTKPSVENRYMTSSYASHIPAATNGNTPYPRDAHLHTPSVTPTRAYPVQSQNQVHIQQHHQPYTAPISFSHYQPHQRGFTPTPRPPYESPGSAQPYGYSNAYGQYPQPPPLNGGAQAYQPASQVRYATASQPPTPQQSMAGTITYNGGVTSGAIHDRGMYREPHGALVQPATHWPLPHHQDVSSHGAPSQHGVQFRHYNSSYKPPS